MGTIDNSPAIYRWVRRVTGEQSRQGRQTRDRVGASFEGKKKERRRKEVAQPVSPLRG